MSKLVKLSSSLRTWHRYLWVSMRHNERGYARQMSKVRVWRGCPKTAASCAMLALSYAKSADQERRLLGL